MKNPPRFVQVGTTAWGAWFFIVIAAVALASCVGTVVGMMAGLR